MNKTPLIKTKQKNRKPFEGKLLQSEGKVRFHLLFFHKSKVRLMLLFTHESTITPTG